MQLIPTGEAGKPRSQFPPVFVGETEIPETDIAREMQHHPAEELSEAWHNAARSLVIRELLLRRADELDISPALDEEVRVAAVIEKLEVPEPDEAACERFFAANPARFRSPTLLAVSHILLAAAPDDLEMRFEQETLAKAILSQLLDNPGRFTELARQHSACESRHQGGSLGQISRGQTVDEFERKVMHMQPGLAAELVESRFGYHIVRVDQRIEGEPLPYEHVRHQIRHYLMESVTRRALRQSLQVLAMAYGVSGVDLELPESPLMQ
ncbi:MAG: peptidylprolyl isomerase [Marinobacter sp.]|nr:peptidylprolyl isomerase [Marinobacter sp.]